MSRIHLRLRPISCLCVLTLSLWLSMASAATTNECAILATGVGSDLAVDDPTRYEHLKQACDNQRLKPSTAPRATPLVPVVQKPGKPSPKAGGPSKPNALQRVADAPAKGDDEKGCPYVFHPMKNLRHPLGTEGCGKNGKLITCKKNSEGVVDWVESFASCSGDNVIDIKNREFNDKELNQLLDGLKLFD